MWPFISQIFDIGYVLITARPSDHMSQSAEGLQIIRHNLTNNHLVCWLYFARNECKIIRICTFIPLEKFENVPGFRFSVE